MQRPNNPKRGDKFRVISEYTLFPKGEIVNLYFDDLTNSPAFINKKGDYYCIPWGDVEPLTKTLDNLEVGDVVVDTIGNEREILCLLPGLYLLSDFNTKDMGSHWYKKSYLKESGYTLKNQPQDDTTELSLQEVADKFGIPVDKLIIKE